jgi:hypothetical protein
VIYDRIQYSIDDGAKHIVNCEHVKWAEVFFRPA